MSRYIDADVLIDDLIHNRSFYPAMVSAAIKNTPTADVVEVVRCKDCVCCTNDVPTRFFCDYFGTSVDRNHYCSYAVRREENET